MAGDHHYVAPKTDGTFGLKVDWKKLSKIPVQSQKGLPFQPIQPVTMEELNTKTLAEWWHWRAWRKASPLQQFSPSGNWKNYAAKHLSGKLPSSTFVSHFIVGLIGIGFIAAYPKNSKHLLVEHH